MTGKSLTKIALIAAAVSLASCSTVKLPDLDILKMTGWLEELRDVEAYPKVSETPDAPTDIRSDAAWDSDAKNLIKMRDEFEALKGDGVVKSDAELAQELDALRAKVRAYKADDPQ